MHQRCCPLCAPPWRGFQPRAPGDFLPDEKVTKESPRAAPFGIPRRGGTALFALAYASRRATFCLQPRWICHFEQVGKLAFISPRDLPGSHSQLSIRGAVGGLPPRMPQTLYPLHQNC